MPGDDALAAARVASPLAVIGRDLKLAKRGREWFASCPFHVDRTPSLHVMPCFWKCFSCGRGGDAIAWVQAYRRLDFAAAVEALSGSSRGFLPGLGRRRSPASFSPDDSDPLEAARVARVRAVWAEGGPVDERTAAHLYLWSRGLGEARRDALRAHPGLWCQEAGWRLPALLAAVRGGADGILTAVQRIWLRERIEVASGEVMGHSGAWLKERKKTLGPMGDGAVRLFEPGPILGLAEGVEDALAAARLFSLPVWAVLGAQRFWRVWIPDTVKEVVVFCDGDEAGLKAAWRAVAHWTGPGRKGYSQWPRPPAKDWNEALLAAAKLS